MSAEAWAPSVDEEMYESDKEMDKKIGGKRQHGEEEATSPKRRRSARIASKRLRDAEQERVHEEEEFQARGVSQIRRKESRNQRKGLLLDEQDQNGPHRMVVNESLAVNVVNLHGPQWVEEYTGEKLLGEERLW